MSLVIDADGHVEENLARARRRHPGGHAAPLEQAYLWAMSFEWRCRQAWHVAAAGGGTPMNRDAARNYGDFFNTHQFTGLFESMARRELRRDPTILD